MFGNHRIQAGAGLLRGDEPAEHVGRNRVNPALGLGDEAGLAGESGDGAGFLHEIAGLDEADRLGGAA